MKKMIQFEVDKEGYKKIKNGRKTFKGGVVDTDMYKFVRIKNHDGAVTVEYGLENRYKNKLLSSDFDRKEIPIEEIDDLFNWINDFTELEKQRKPLDSQASNHEIVYDRLCTPNFGKDAFRVKKGKVLVNKYGKYKPNITFILPRQSSGGEYVDEPEELVKRMNVTYKGNSVDAIRGDYRISRKGKSVFEISENGKHVLLAFNWGGAFGKGKGDTTNIPKADIIYTRNAKSNGGGSGMFYTVLPYNYQVLISEEDL